MLINVSQINGSQLTLFVQQATSGASFSGNFVAYVAGSGWLGNNVVYTTGGLQFITGTKVFLDSPRVPYSGHTGTAPSAGWVNDQIGAASGGLNSALIISGALLYSWILIGSGGGGGSPNAVTITGDQVIAGFKTFSGSPFVPNPTQPSGAVNYAVLSGVSGVLAAAGGGGSPNSVTTTGNEVIGGFKQFTGSPFVPAPTAQSGAANLAWVTGISGVLQSGISLITGLSQGPSGVPGPSGATGPIGNLSISGITGNFVNIAFWYDQYNLATGLNSIEAVVGRSFFFTGYSIGVIETGTQGFFSGSFYQRTPTNVKTRFIDFSLNSGQLFISNGGFVQTISGLNRIGLDIYRIGTGITGLSIGIFGVGY